MLAAQTAAVPGIARADAFTMRLSLPNPTASVPAVSALRFAAAVYRRTNGQLKIEVYPNGTLAKEAETLDGLTSGVVDLGIQSAAVLSRQVPRFQIFDVPFLFDEAAAAYRVLDGALGDEFFADLDAKGIVGLNWGVGGFKVFETTTRAIVAPEDMKGLRFRAQSGALQVAMFQALGAIPVAIDMSETLLALTQKTVDGSDFVLDSIANGKFYIAVKHIAMSNHVLTVLPLLGSKKKIDALPAPMQKIVKEEGRAVLPFWRDSLAKQTADQIKFLKANGVAFTEIKHPEFRKAMDPVYAIAQQKVGNDLIARVARAATGAK
jgi:tripartite ATP-independent transporter DctP family solute receptor